MNAIALEGICETVAPAEFDFSWWFDPFGLEPADIVRDILPKAADKARLVSGCAANRTFKPFTLPPGEPEGELLTWPGTRCGLAMLVAARDGERMLTALWPFTTDGVEHEISIDRVLLAPDRLQAVIEGTIGDTLTVSWLDVQFAADRAYYAEGSVHKVVLAGIAHRFAVGAPPPVRIPPDAPSYATLRQNLRAEALDGAIVIRTEGMAAIFPLDDAPMTLHSIQGPVKRIDEYGGEMFGRKIWRLRVTVARIGDSYDNDVDLDVFLTDVVLDGRPLPAVGDDVSATVRLQGRIWQPNVQRKG